MAVLKKNLLTEWQRQEALRRKMPEGEWNCFSKTLMECMSENEKVMFPDWEGLR